MPEIPLFNGGETIKTGAIPQMPLDNQRRPRADFRGIISGLGELAQRQRGLAEASQQPTLDPNMFNGLDKGYKALAEGIKDVGGFLEKYAEKRQEVINERDIGRASSEMQKVYAEHVTQRDRTRPETWEQDLVTRMTGLRTRIDSDKHLSRYAKETIGYNLDQYTAGRVAALTIESSEVIHKEAGDQLEEQIVEARRVGDLGRVKYLRTKMVTGNHLSADAAARRLANDQRIVQQEQMYREIDSNPRMARAELDEKDGSGNYSKYAWLTIPQRESMRQYTEGVLQGRQGRILENLTDWVLQNDGKPIFPDEVDAFDPQGLLNAAQKESVRQHVAGTRVKLGKPDMEAAVARIDGYRKEEDADGKDLTAIKAAVTLGFDGETRRKLLHRLNQRAGQAVEALPLGVVTAYLNKLMTEDKVFGQYEFQKRDANGHAILIKNPARHVEVETSKWNMLLYTLSGGRLGRLKDREEAAESFSYEMQTDEVQRARAASVVESIRETIEQEKVDGKFTSVDDMVRRVSELVVTKGYKLPVQSGRVGSRVADDLTIPQHAGDMSGRSWLLPSPQPISSGQAVKRMGEITKKNSR